MRIAIVHDSLNEFGGAERFLISLLKIFPHADIFTLSANKTILKLFSRKYNFSNLHKPNLTSIMRRGSLMQLFSPILWKQFDFDEYDIVFSSSSFLMSNLVKVKKPVHIQYIHCLPKNIYGFTPKNKLQNLFDYSFFIKPLFETALRSTPYIIANSKYMQSLLNSIFQIQSHIIYPPVTIPLKPEIKKLNKYFISVSRINRMKNIELIIRSCNFLKVSLKIIGSGSDEKYKKKLQSIAGPTVEFLNFKSENELRFLYQSAIAIICASENEDFGISAVEAQAHGVPVVAYNNGGYKETIQQKKTGILYNQLSIPALTKSLLEVQKHKFNQNDLYINTKRFSEEVFIRNMKEYVRAVINKSLQNSSL